MEASFSPPNLKRIGYPKNTIYMIKDKTPCDGCKKKYTTKSLVWIKGRLLCDNCKPRILLPKKDIIKDIYE